MNKTVNNDSSTFWESGMAWFQRMVTFAMVLFSCSQVAHASSVALTQSRDFPETISQKMFEEMEDTKDEWNTLQAWGTIWNLHKKAGKPMFLVYIKPQNGSADYALGYTFHQNFGLRRANSFSEPITIDDAYYYKAEAGSKEFKKFCSFGELLENADGLAGIGWDEIEASGRVMMPKIDGTTKFVGRVELKDLKYNFSQIDAKQRDEKREKEKEAQKNAEDVAAAKQPQESHEPPAPVAPPENRAAAVSEMAPASQQMQDDAALVQRLQQEQWEQARREAEARRVRLDLEKKLKESREREAALRAEKRARQQQEQEAFLERARHEAEDRDRRQREQEAAVARQRREAQAQEEARRAVPVAAAQAAVVPQPPSLLSEIVHYPVVSYTLIGLIHGLTNSWLSGGSTNQHFWWAPWKEWATALTFWYFCPDRSNDPDEWAILNLFYGAAQLLGETIPRVPLTVIPSPSSVGPWRNRAINRSLATVPFLIWVKRR